MKSIKQVYFTLFIVSASIVCFEIVSTRISSVIFAYNYAFIILSLAILGLGIGGIFAHYKIRTVVPENVSKIILRSIILIGVILLLFILLIVQFSITNQFIYFFLLILPFFFAGIAYSQIFKLYAEHSFRLYAYDLAGAATGSIASILVIGFFGAPNCMLFLSAFILCSALAFYYNKIKKVKLAGYFLILAVSIILLILNGNTSIIGEVPIGEFPEKDFYHVYSDPLINSQIIESKWSIYGRSDLVEYNNQDYVKQLFVDGAAGTQVYRFNGNRQKPDKMLYNLLLSQTTSIPFLFLTDQEKNNMLAIGPGGGKEILIGLLDGVKKITGIEVNPDFVSIVKKHKEFDGGIYNNYPDVNIMVKEGRNYVAQTNQLYDLIVMSLPSTEQLQNINSLAMNENYLLTVEAIKGYLNRLTPDGRLIFTVHNNLELLRLIITAMAAFNEKGISDQKACDHFLIVETDYAPTIVIKKNSFHNDEILHTQSVMKIIPKIFPNVTYLPGNNYVLPDTKINQFLGSIKDNRIKREEYVNQSKFNIKPCVDDSPYFYKLNRGVPEDYLWLLAGITFINLAVFVIPFSRIKKNVMKNKLSAITLPLFIFTCIGLGFMILEVSLFQKMILYLGSPTISLSILLGSLLVGMGTGSFVAEKIFPGNIRKRLLAISLAVVLGGIILFIIYPLILNIFLSYSLIARTIISTLIILPFGFLLGIPFPVGIQLLKNAKVGEYVPWMYGINGTMSVLGSVIAVVVSMLFGFTASFFIGLSFYLVIYLKLVFSKQ